MRRSLTSFLQTLAVVTTVLIAGIGNAQECMLGPMSLPGLSGPPEWQDFGSGKWRPELHDPRWSGSSLDFLSYLPVSGIQAAQDEVGIRVLADGAIVYLSFQANSDDNGPTADDYVYVGLTDGGTGAVALRVAANTSGTGIPTPATPPPPNVVIADSPLPTQLAATGVTTWTSVNGTTWGASSSTTPTWLKGAVWDRSSSTVSPKWAITLRLDLSSTGLNVTPGNMRYFFGTTVNKTVGDVLVGNVIPKTATDTNKVGDSIIPSDVSTWVQYYYPGTDCTAGITLAASEVGVWTGTPGSYSGGSLTNVICAGPGGVGSCATSTGVNTFRVTARKVDNTSGIGTFAVRARVRIADWGAQVAYWQFGRWTDVAVGNPTGTAIFNADATTLQANGWTWLTPVDAGDTTSAVTIDYTCTKQGTDTYCPKLADPSQHHQCMLVELGQPPPGPNAPPQFKIKNNAVYRNMNYENLSTSDVPATISIEGLKDALGAAEAKDRDVYLYLETVNLPAHSDKPVWLRTRDMDLVRQLAEHPPFVPTIPGKRPPPGPNAGAKPSAANADTVKKARAVRATKASLEQSRTAALVASGIALSTAKLSNGLPLRNVLAMAPQQLLDAVWPTYRVRAYYDSGRNQTTNGKTNRVLVPMVPFGFHFSHDGALYGFSHALTAMSGVAVEKLSANWYKLHLRSESKVGIRTHVVAEESPKAAPIVEPGAKPSRHGCHCRLVRPARGAFHHMGAVLVLGVMLLARRRRQQP